MTHTCDYLIIGGGSSGAVVARRLAERHSGRIILIEAGKSDEGDPAALDLKRLDEQTPDYDWGFRAAPLPGSPPLLNYARAKLLGGCANHNDCAFIRPPDSDFDAWERLGATGWNARRDGEILAAHHRHHHHRDRTLPPGQPALHRGRDRDGPRRGGFRPRGAAGRGAVPAQCQGPPAAIILRRLSPSARRHCRSTSRCGRSAWPRGSSSRTAAPWVPRHRAARSARRAPWCWRAAPSRRRS